MITMNYISVNYLSIGFFFRSLTLRLGLICLLMLTIFMQVSAQLPCPQLVAIQASSPVSITGNCGTMPGGSISFQLNSIGKAKLQHCILNNIPFNVGIRGVNEKVNNILGQNPYVQCTGANINIEVNGINYVGSSDNNIFNQNMSIDYIASDKNNYFGSNKFNWNFFDALSMGSDITWDNSEAEIYRNIVQWQTNALYKGSLQNANVTITILDIYSNITMPNYTAYLTVFTQDFNLPDISSYWLNWINTIPNGTSSGFNYNGIYYSFANSPSNPINILYHSMDNTYIPPNPSGPWPVPPYVPQPNVCIDGCPVDLATGEEGHSPGPDLTSMGPGGLQAPFTRTFYTTHAKARYMSPGLTVGWSHNYDTTIQPVTPGNWGPMYLLDAAGGQDILSPVIDQNTNNPNGSFIVTPGSPYIASGTLGANPGDWQSIVLTYQDGTVKTFTEFSPAIFMLSKISDKFARPLQINWDVNRKLTSVVETNTQTSLLTCSYDADGFLSDIIDNAGRKIHYTYAVPGNGITVNCLMTASQICAATNTAPPVQWNYSYYAFQGNPLIASYSDPDPSSTTGGQRSVSFTYDPNTGKVATQTTIDGNVHSYNYAQGQTQVSVANGGLQCDFRTVAFDDMGRNLGESDANGNSTSRAYDDVCNPWRATTLVDRNGNTTNYSYDQYGNTLTKLDNQGSSTNCTYDYSHNPLGRLTSMQKDAQTPVTFSYHPATGLLKSITTAAPGISTQSATTTFTYDFEQNPSNNFGRIVEVDHPGNNAVATMTDTYSYNYTYDPAYDVNGKPGTYQANSIGLPLTVTDKHGRVTHYRYDAYGDVTVIIDPDGNVTNKTYNMARQMTSVLHPAAAPGNGQRQISISYLYPGGLPWQYTTSFGQGANWTTLLQVQKTYNADGLVQSITGGSDPVSYTYNQFGQMLTMTDGKHNTTTYAYDAYNRLSSITYPDNTTTKFSAYDLQGNPLMTIDGNDVSTSYGYDAVGHVISIDRPNMATRKFNYNSNGQLIYATDSEGSYEYEYDDTGHLLSQSITYTNLPTATISYQYYPDGSLQQLITPAGSYNYQYNSDGKLIALTNPAGRTSRWTYNADELMRRQQLGNHAWTMYHYDTLKHIDHLLNYSPKGAVLSEYSNFTRDELDNLPGMTCVMPGMPNVSGTASYQYDALSQLTDAKWTASTLGNGGSSDQAVSYDAVGNPLQGPQELPNYAGQSRAYDAGNRWVGYGDAVNGNNLFNYDGNGNPTTYAGNALAFNADNQLTSYTNATTNTNITAGYCYNGLRAWKSVNNGPRTYYLYNGTQPICELAADGVTVNAYMTWGTTRLLNRTNLQTNREIWYLFDPLGNVAQRLDATGYVRSAERYDAWGSPTPGGDIVDPYGWHAQQGYYTDHETGLLLCTHRYYDPLAGRWITKDPIGYRGGIELYAYCKNRLVMGVDPSGEDFEAMNPELAGELAELLGDATAGVAVSTPVITSTGVEVGTVAASSIEALFAEVEAADAAAAAQSMAALTDSGIAAEINAIISAEPVISAEISMEMAEAEAAEEAGTISSSDYRLILMTILGLITSSSTGNDHVCPPVASSPKPIPIQLPPGFIVPAEVQDDWDQFLAQNPGYQVLYWAGQMTWAQLWNAFLFWLAENKGVYYIGGLFIMIEITNFTKAPNDILANQLKQLEIDPTSGQNVILTPFAWATPSQIAQARKTSNWKVLGDIAEQIKVQFLKDLGYQDVTTIKNRSNHGIDIIIENPADGLLIPDEVKQTTQTNGNGGNLSDRQQTLVSFFINVINRARKGIGFYGNIDPVTKQLAEDMYNQYYNGDTPPKRIRSLLGWHEIVDFNLQMIKFRCWN